MNTHADKTQENKSQSAAHAISQKQSGSASTFYLEDNRPETVAQLKLQEVIHNSTSQLQPIQKKENNTGLPDDLKSGIENLSGYAMDDVKVHRNSDKPSQLQAHAYAQGTDIHLGPGQEKHLPHEAWHVVQQKQGRVQPTMQMKGKVHINDDDGLEKEADVMGAKALQKMSNDQSPQTQQTHINVGAYPTQLMDDEEYEALDENLQEGANEKELRFAVMRSIEEILSTIKVEYRFGGSIAAMIHGGKRTPNDIDIDYGGEKENVYKIKKVLTSEDFKDLIQGKLSKDKIEITEIGSASASITMIYAKDVVMSERFKHMPELGSMKSIQIDYAWEGTLADKAGFTTSLGEEEQGGVVTQQEVLQRYLNRMINEMGTSEEKGDIKQIDEILSKKDKSWMTSEATFGWIMENYNGEAEGAPPVEEYLRVYKIAAEKSMPIEKTT